jgi:Protein of unknown function (DUF3306)
MSEDRFLKRWSRRKQEARANAAPPEAVLRDDVQSAPPAIKDEEFEFDLSSLPPIDSITSATDIKAFLHRGIPQELKRAALRRAWSADPAICDFVGLAENAWDFNDPTAMPGFGPLDCSEAELAALVDRIFGSLGKAAQSRDRSVEPEDSSRELLQEEEPAAVTDAADGPAATEFASAPVAAQPAEAEDSKDEADPVRRCRTHGGALPS